ncbi:MAG: hypothetical protein AAGU25_03815 [bacterium]|jgi:hypothetical protein
MNVENVKMDLHLEKELSNALNQIKPDPDFVNQLYRKITQTGQVQAEAIRKGASLAVIGGALFAGALIIWVVKMVRGKNRE